MTSSKGKLSIILLAFAVLATASMACNIEPGDGQVSDAVIKGHGAIQDTADAVMDAVESTGEGIEIETHGTVILDAVWDVAKDIAASDAMTSTQGDN